VSLVVFCTVLQKSFAGVLQKSFYEAQNWRFSILSSIENRLYI